MGSMAVRYVMRMRQGSRIRAVIILLMMAMVAARGQDGCCGKNRHDIDFHLSER